MCSGSEAGSCLRRMVLCITNSRRESDKEEEKFRVWGSGFRVKGWGFCIQSSRKSVQWKCSVSRVEGSVFSVKGSVFRVSGLRVWFRVSGFGLCGSRDPGSVV